MATDAIAPVNGTYGAASQTSSQSASYTNGASEPTSNSQTGKDEVGWYFVEQYYTTMSRSPEKVHLFYNKRSQFVYGVETEKVPVSVGQKAINERISELGIDDCKVRVTNVDSQESGKSIVLQVIGEMSVKGQPHRKFAQTFVLAEQPNGYFVLNDIFRYIADEPDEEEELENTAEVAATEPTETKEEIKTLSSSDNLVEQARAAEVVDKKLEQAVPREEPTVEATSAHEPVMTEAGPVDEPTPASDAPQADVASVEEATLELEKPKDPEPTPSISPAPVAAQAPPPKATPAPTPAPAKPAAPKTWASMLATNKAPPAVPVVPNIPATQAQPKSAPTPAAAAPSTATQAAPATSQAPVADAEVPASPGGWQSVGQDHGKKTNRNQAPAIVNGYIKNVTPAIEDAALKAHLSQYGEIVYFDVSRPKQCAFLEFKTPAGYTAAAGANPHKIGGETILVEERRPRGNTFGNNFRGGARGGPAGRGGPGGRGGFVPRGRGGPAGRGRGGAQDA